MKHWLLATSLIICGFSSAQTEKGTLLPGGGLSFQADTEGNLVLNFNPRLGVFVKDHLAVGGSLTVVTGFDDVTVYGAGAFIRPYFGKGKSGKLFVDAFASILGASENGSARFSYGTGIGYAIFLNKAIALEIGLYYYHFDEASNVFMLGTGFGIHWKKNRKESAAN